MEERIKLIMIEHAIRKRKAVRRAERIIDTLIAIVLALLLAIGCYAIWDNHQVYESAGAAQWKAYKPLEDNWPTFYDLKAINPEVVAWLELYGTNIDYPVCQSLTNPMKYLTTDPFGSYTLSGSLFIDPSAKWDFSDKVTFIFGHHMDSDTMFGPIDHFMDQSFLDEHCYGYMFAGDKDVGLEMWCAFRTSAYDDEVYRHGIDSEEVFVPYVEMLKSRAQTIRDIDIQPTDRLVIMSTCSSEMTDGRTLLVARMLDEVPENPFIDWPNTGTGVDTEDLLNGLPWYCWAAIGVTIALLLLLLLSLLLAFLRREKLSLAIETEGLLHFVLLIDEKTKGEMLLDTFYFEDDIVPLGWDKTFESDEKMAWTVEKLEVDNQVVVFFRSKNNEELVFVDTYRTDTQEEGSRWEKVFVPVEGSEDAFEYKPVMRLVLKDPTKKKA